MKYWELKDYKYILAEDYITGIRGINWFKIEYKSGFLDLSLNTLEIKKGYAWDGASGPAIDTKNFMLGSLVHDTLYQIIRELNPVNRKELRKEADQMLRHLCIYAGMSKIRAWWVYRAVRIFGSLYNKSSKDHKRKLIEV